MRLLRRPRPRRPRAPQPGPVDQAARLSETPVTFAGAGRASTETVIASARSCSCGIETAIAFAGEKWAFLVQFSGAEVMPVSTSPCCRASCAKKFALRVLMVGVSAKKFALHAQNTPKSAFYGVLGELLRGRAAGEAVLGEFFRGNASGEALVGELIRGGGAGEAVLGEFFRGPAVVGSRGASCVAPRPW